MPKPKIDRAQLPLRLNLATYAKLVRMAEMDGRSLNNWIEHNIDYTAETRGLDKCPDCHKRTCTCADDHWKRINKRKAEEKQTCAHCAGDGCMLCSGLGYYDIDGP